MQMLPRGECSQCPWFDISLLLAGFCLQMLFVVNRYSPDPAPMARYGTPIDEAVVRIRYDHEWPKKVVFDTSIPTIVPPAASAPAVATTTAPSPAQGPALDALAEARPPEPLLVEKHKQRVHNTGISRREAPMRLRWLTLCLFAYVLALATVHVPWDEAVKGHSFPESRSTGPF